ncbi:MAG: hypothetical protein AMXMBFR36_09170 [Acidobacteriota bacterium]
MRDRILAEVRRVFDSPIGGALRLSDEQIERSIASLESWLPYEEDALVVMESANGEVVGFRYRLRDVVAACATIGAGIAAWGVAGALTALAGLAVLSGARELIAESYCLILYAAHVSGEALSRKELAEAASRYSGLLSGRIVPPAELECSVSNLLNLGVLSEEGGLVSLSEVCLVDVDAGFFSQGRY